MLEAPTDLAPDLIASTLRDYWNVVAVDVAYAAIGHGSHNWTVEAADGEKWFVKADRTLESDSRLAAYRTAAALREAGLSCVHSAIRDQFGELRRRVSDAWEMAVFPFIEGHNPDFSNNAERSRIAEAIGQVHSHRPIPRSAQRWFPGWRKPELVLLLATELDRRWSDGPYAASARALILDSLPGIRDLLNLHGRLADQLGASDEPWVITHGEPHGGNTMVDRMGRLHLIDCDDLMLAPRERDLWLLLQVGHQRALVVDNTDIRAAYRRTAGPVEPRPSVIELMRADWHLREISAYAEDFSRPHEDSEDLAAHWRTLNTYLPVSQNWTAPLEQFADL